ncbi:MAG: DUF1598 domain-containing protein [Planctomycetaceae bacterium]
MSSDSRSFRLVSHKPFLMAAAAWGLCSVATCFAQFGGAGGNAGGGAGGGGNQFGGGNQVGGILIDADGVLRSLESKAISPKLQQAARDAFVAEKLAQDLVSYSGRRHVSLMRLERECERRLEAGGAIDEDLRYLAGLQRIDFLFVDPQRADLVIAGPAEGFVPDAAGRMVGLTTGRPPLRLDDLIVALRSAGSGATAIGCSIDPEPARLAQMQEYVAHNSTETSPAGAARRYERMAEVLGPQQISVFGVPADSHFALTLVEADFRMKRMSLGIEPSGVRGLKSHLSLVTPGGNSIQRWWFTPLYDGLSTTPDRTAFQLAGQRVQLHAQEEIATPDGERSDAPVTRASTHTFARMFTENFPQLAERSPLFAELQNLFDLAIVAALIQQESLVERSGRETPMFSQAGPELVPAYAVARQVPSMSTCRKARRGLILGLVGGVTIEPGQVLRRFDSGGEPAARLAGIRRASLESAPPDTQPWWWD